jgi:hypothetical protein
MNRSMISLPTGAMQTANIKVILSPGGRALRVNDRSPFTAHSHRLDRPHPFEWNPRGHPRSLCNSISQILLR